MCPVLLTYLLTPRSRVLLEKLASLQLVKKLPAFYGTRRFLTALTSARHLSLSSASPIQSSYPNPTSWRSILMLSSIYAWVSPAVSSPRVSPPAPCTLLSLHHTGHMPRPSHSSRFYHPHEYLYTYIYILCPNKSARFKVWAIFVLLGWRHWKFNICHLSFLLLAVMERHTKEQSVIIVKNWLQN